MEGKLTYQRTLPRAEAERVFNLLKHKRDQFITVDRNAASSCSQRTMQGSKRKSSNRRIR
jgi:hypothetical protein